MTGPDGLPGAPDDGAALKRSQAAEGPPPAVPIGTVSPHTDPQAAARARWALLFGNFCIGCGVMVTAGTMNALLAELDISLTQGGHLIAAASIAIAVLAPPLAALLGPFDRRRLLTLSLLWYAIGHGAAALVPDYGALLPMRVVGVLAAAVFTPQAAATIGVLSDPAQRGRAITFVFLGWSLASVLGMPLSAAIGSALGWRAAFGLVGVLSLLAAVAVWRVVPDRVRPPAMSMAHWREALTHPALAAIVLVTVFSASGQFTLFPFFAPYYRDVLGASVGQISLMFAVFGALGVAGNVWTSRRIDRLGAARAVNLMLCSMAVALLAFPLGTSVWMMLLVLAPWALGSFSSNSAQQARLSMAAPTLTAALVALNTSAIYAGQAIGASLGAELHERHGYGPLHWVGLAWMLVALASSMWGTRRLNRQPVQVH